MKEIIKNFLIENKDLIYKNDIEALYDKLGNEKSPFYGKIYANDLSRLFIDAGIEVITPSMKLLPSRMFMGDEKMSTIDIPDNISAIGQFAFALCTNLSKVTLPSGLKVLGKGVFYHCISLEEISLPESLHKIWPMCFSECTALKEIIIPAGVTRIEARTFEECYSLTNVILPESLTYIGKRAFDRCTQLKNIYIPPSVKTIDLEAFDYGRIVISCRPNSSAYYYAQDNGIEVITV